MASPIPASGPYWLHWGSIDEQPLGTAIANALLHAAWQPFWGTNTTTAGSPLTPTTEKKGPLDSDQRIADLRALLFGSMWLYNELSTSRATIREWGAGETAVPFLTTQKQLIEVSPRGGDQFSSPERWEWVKAGTQRTWALLYERLALVGVSADELLPTRIGTIGGQLFVQNLESWKGGGVVPSEAGAAWVLPAIGMVLGAATVCFMVDRGALIVDRILARHSDAAALIATQAKVMSVLNEHREAEKAAGKELPLSSSESDVLKLLQGLQDGFSKRNGAAGPFPSAIPSGSDVASTMTWGVIVAGAAFVALMLLRK